MKPDLWALRGVVTPGRKKAGDQGLGYAGPGSSARAVAGSD